VSDSEEEPYSIIFASLKHPVRRRILRMLAEKPKSFSEMLGTLGVSGSFLTYHLENLGELVCKTEDGKYKLSMFGEAAMVTMSKVEDVPKATPLQLDGQPQTSSSRWSTPMRISRALANIYTFILVGALILASVYFINFVTSSGPSMTGDQYYPILVAPNGTSTFKMAIVYHNPDSNVWRAILKNDTYILDVCPPYVTPTSWNALSITADMRSQNGLFDAIATTHFPDKHNQTYEYEGTLTVWFMSIYQNATDGTYEFEIRNISSQEINATIDVHWTQKKLTKPYFYYGNAGLVIALIGFGLGSLYPLLVFFKFLMRYPEERDFDPTRS
jgi:DNA-binding transcriptional ArsR family regulator